MDELELRVCAIEMLLIELGPYLDRQALEGARQSIEAGMDGASAEEVVVRRQAVSLIEDARERFNGWNLSG